ncbi:MAG: LacI family transcriptional regulator [Lachnospiraceae bacterium]|nr:LacI family transcriptional regulator [Lachnospiraceae bacterium]
MGITAKELSRRLNLSETAVSMALNNRPGVSQETRERVIKEAEKMGYDFSRLSMKKNHARTIYCVMWRAHNAILKYAPIFSELTDGIMDECRKHEYQLRTIQIYEKIDNFQQTLEDLRVSGCAGIILLGTEITPDICRDFLTLSVPVVLLDTYFESLECSCVLINNTQGAYLATGYLIDRTQKQPGYLKSSYRIENFEERRTGFIRTIREHGMSAAKSIQHELTPSKEGAFSDMLEILDRGDDIARCYFADNDLIAIGAIRAFKLRGYKIPDDVAVIGFDNISEGKIVEPSLTTIDIPRKFMGQLAARQLLTQIANPISHAVKIEVSTRIVKRFSV